MVVTIRGAVDRLAGLPISWILVIAITARLVAGMAFSAGSTSLYEYGTLARHIADGNGYSYVPADDQGPVDPDEVDESTRWLPSAYMPPLYTYVAVVATYAGGGSDTGTIWALRGLNALMAGATVLVLRTLTLRLVGSTRAATLAALGFAVYPSAVYAATQVSAANLYIPLQMTLLLALLAAVRSPGAGRWAMAGAAMGLLCLLRAETVPLVPIAVVWLWWASRTRATVRRRVRSSLVFLAAATLLPGLWLVRNSLTFGEPTYTIATSGGLNLWIGNHPGASGSAKSFEIPSDLASRLDNLPPTDDYELRAEATYREFAVDSITSDPWGTAARDGKKLGLLLGVDIYDSRSRNPVYLGAWLVVGSLGIMGAVGWWRRRDRPGTTKVLIAGYLAANIAVPVFFFALARYKLPIEMMAIVFAAAWLASRVPTASSADTAVEPEGCADDDLAVLGVDVTVLPSA
jgi:4-amino-4-deoxy-L-arabinose transferase-like glycosyltransferase